MNYNNAKQILEYYGYLMLTPEKEYIDENTEIIIDCPKFSHKPHLCTIDDFESQLHDWLNCVDDNIFLLYASRKYLGENVEEKHIEQNMIKIGEYSRLRRMLKNENRELTTTFGNFRKGKKIEYKCKDHISSQYYHDFMDGSRCTTCSHKSSFSNECEEFFKKNNCILKSQYVNNKIPLEYNCEKCLEIGSVNYGNAKKRNYVCKNCNKY